ncbi:MAG: alpha/beta hydrolase fold domain-containing protein, partial [Planctomycetota bacterium]
MTQQVRFCGFTLAVLAAATGCLGEASGSAAPRPAPSQTVVTGLLPETIPNEEEKLLTEAKAADVVALEGGYRQVDLVVARVATWEGDRKLSVRLFLPPVRDGQREADPQARALVAYIHGGGFIGGSPKMNLLSKGGGFHRPVRALLDEGFAVASLGYRLAREAGWPAPVSDTLCGLRFLQQHGQHWGVDATRVGICGHSAGARTAALVAMVPQDAFHTQDLPWQGAPVSLAAVWLWAGSAWTAPNVDNWEEFGKPRQYSVKRLHFGEHPAWDHMARHRLRLRNVFPHLSQAMPPIHLLRGESDYGGDHADARRTVEIWKALGSEATLSVVPGGHNTTGPSQPTVAFFRRHLVTHPFNPPAREPLETAAVLLKQGEPAAALEVLSARYTSDEGRTPPPGGWMILHDGTLLWLPDPDSWPAQARPAARRACQMLAEAEAAAAKEFLARRQWFRSLEAAENVRRLADADDVMESLLTTVRGACQREESVFRALARANEHLHAGQRDKAIQHLATVDDQRTRAAAERIQADEAPEAPDWATSSGIDVYGRWADLPLAGDVTVRMRWVSPGAWDLPEHLQYRNDVKQPRVKRVAVEYGFWLAETPTTVAQWHAMTAEQVPQEADSADLPQTRVDYLQIVDWLERLSSRHDGLTARLPTEEEWLHAATLGGRSDTRAATDLHAVHALNVDPNDPGPLAVRTVLPCLGGFYGMLGGVHE